MCVLFYNIGLCYLFVFEIVLYNHVGLSWNIYMLHLLFLRPSFNLNRLNADVKAVTRQEPIICSVSLLSGGTFLSHEEQSGLEFEVWVWDIDWWKIEFSRQWQQYWLSFAMQVPQDSTQELHAQYPKSHVLSYLVFASTLNKDDKIEPYKRRTIILPHLTVHWEHSSDGWKETGT